MTTRRTLGFAALAGATLGVAVALGATGAIAARGVLSPTDETKAVLDDTADRLGVEPDELEEALRAALAGRVDAAVEAGRLTDEQGERLKERIESGALPPPFGGLGAHGLGHPGLRLGHVGHLDAAASYLGLDETELHERLADGMTLAEIARAEGKSVDGLVQALVEEARSRLDDAVAGGRLTREQADELAEELEERVTGLVEGERPEHGFGPRFGREHPFGSGPHSFGLRGPHA